MKKYISISITLCIFSSVNALTYFILGLTLGDTSYSNIFSITYSFQFISIILTSIFASASNIRANKENNKNCTDTGIVVGTFTGIIIFGLIILFINNFLSFMSLDTDKFKTLTIMLVVDIFFSYIVNLVSEKYYFVNKDKIANLCSIGFICLNLISITLASLITKNQTAIAIINLTCLLIYCAIWLVLTVKKFKFDFNIVKNFKYESTHIISNLFMFIIYFWGYKRAFEFEDKYIIALNFVNLITDPFWDSLEAISKIAKIQISKGEFNHRLSKRNSLLLTLFYCFIICLLFFALFSLYSVSITIALIFLAIQIVDMLLYAIKANIQSYLQIEFSATKCTVINLVCKVIRTLLSLIIFSPFNTNIGQIVGGLLSYLIFLIFKNIYFYTDKNGFLVRKECICKN